MVTILGSAYGSGRSATPDLLVSPTASVLRPSTCAAPVVARIPLPTDAERTALEDSAWDHLEAQWDDWAKRRTENAADYEERAKLEREAAAMGEAMALKAKNLRGN